MEPSSKVIYLNTAACGLIEEEVIAAGNNFYSALAVKGSGWAEQWRMTAEPRIRATIASFIGAKPDNVAMVPNFSWALNGVVQSLKGDERVLLYRHDYPSLIEPFRINNFDIKWIDTEDGFTLPVEEIKQLIRNNEIDIAALSHVQYNSGYMLDIQEIGALCRKHNVLFIVDATQSMGAMPISIDTTPVDILIWSNYKWMNAGFGTGVLYIADGFLHKYTPVMGGHNSYQMRNDTWMYVPSILSYEPGHPNMYGLTILEAAINHKQKAGIESIAKHNSLLTALLLDKIKELPVAMIGPATTDNRASFILLKDKDGLEDWLKQHNIVTTNRNGLIRISMHYYNTAADVMGLVECISNKYK
ncbi:MAG: aminotransferase class V-fold PLP-dependent enzyme [Taibaiella sp.]|nr:aminotransferase class V-fold PLP-dependent enzyme [Taibaiella sp.]